jgi:hypothetical protein
MDNFNFSQFDDIIQNNFYADDFSHMKANFDDEEPVQVDLDFDSIDDDSENFDFI